MGVERVWRVRCDECTASVFHAGFPEPTTRARAIAVARELGARVRVVRGRRLWLCVECLWRYAEIGTLGCVHGPDALSRAMRDATERRDEAE